MIPACSEHFQRDPIPGVDPKQLPPFAMYTDAQQFVELMSSQIKPGIGAKIQAELLKRMVETYTAYTFSDVQFDGSKTAQLSQDLSDKEQVCSMMEAE